MHRLSSPERRRYDQLVEEEKRLECMLKGYGRDGDRHGVLDSTPYDDVNRGRSRRRRGSSFVRFGAPPSGSRKERPSYSSSSKSQDMNKTKQNVRRQIDQFKEECLRVEKEIDRKNLELAEALKQSQKILLDRVVHQANETIALHRESDTVESECNALMEKLSARNRLLRYTIEQLNMFREDVSVERASIEHALGIENLRTVLVHSKKETPVGDASAVARGE